MSYDLIYDKQFIKAEKEGKEVFFPMFYGGSSNCYEIGSRGRCGRRERSWYNSTYTLQGRRYGTLEEMIESTNAERLRVIESNKKNIEQYGADWGDYSDKRFGYFIGLAIGGSHTTKTTFGNYQGLFRTGCQKALTVEELLEFGVTVNVYTPTYNDVEEILKKVGKEKIYFSPKTSKELIEKLEEFEEYLKDVPSVHLQVTLRRADEQTMKTIRRSKFPDKTQKTREYVNVDKYFVVKDVLDNNYIIKATRSGYRYSLHGECYAKKFAKETAAKRWAKALNKKYNAEDKFVVETINKELRILV